MPNAKSTRKKAPAAVAEGAPKKAAPPLEPVDPMTPVDGGTELPPLPATDAPVFDFSTKETKAMAASANISPEVSGEYTEEQLDELVLYLYDPDALGRSKVGQYSRTAIMIPVPSGFNQVGNYRVPAFEQKALSPGLQRIPRRVALAIENSEAPGVVDARDRNVLRFWSDETELVDMTPNKAIDSIRKTESVVLLSHWVKRFSELTRSVQQEMIDREKEMQASFQSDMPKQLYGRAVG